VGTGAFARPAQRSEAQHYHFARRRMLESPPAERIRAPVPQNNTFGFYFFAFAIVMIAVIVTLAIRDARQRTKDLAEAAQRLGFQFLGNNWTGPILRSGHKPPLFQRTRGRFSNAMSGSSGNMQMSLFDYIYG
jgi:hypothetical protein